MQTATLHTVDECRDGGVVLKLEERSFQHVLGVNFLDTKQIQHHVVRQVKRTVQRVGIALHFSNKALTCPFTGPRQPEKWLN